MIKVVQEKGRTQVPYKNPEHKRQWEREHREQRNAQHRMKRLEAKNTLISRNPVSDRRSNETLTSWTPSLVGLAVFLLAVLSGTLMPKLMKPKAL